MDFVGVIVIFFISWWVSLLAVLPIGVESQFENDGDVLEGTEEGAPKSAMLKKKAIWATIGAVVITGLAYFLIVPYLARG
ncbi:MAG: DUF1467 family protein [Pseudomonadota bacterium]